MYVYFVNIRMKTKQSKDYLSYSDSRSSLNREKKEEESKYLSSDLEDMLKQSQKKFWSYVKYKTKGQHCSVPTLKTPTGELAPEPVDKANILNRHFQSVFTDKIAANAPDIPNRTEQMFSLKNIKLHKPGIINLIKNLNKHKSPGPDKISPRFLKLVPEEISEYLLLLYDKCFELKIIPSQWKTAHVTPVFKKGSRANPENYRPISLTSVLCKMFEHIITSNLATFLEENELFNRDQFGFRKIDHVNSSCKEFVKI